MTDILNLKTVDNIKWRGFSIDGTYTTDNDVERRSRGSVRSSDIDTGNLSAECVKDIGSLEILETLSRDRRNRSGKVTSSYCSVSYDNSLFKKCPVFFKRNIYYCSAPPNRISTGV